MLKPKLKKTIFFIISGPSGAGEDSVIEGLAKKIKFERVITTVTRPKRPGEKDGSPYYFISVPEFRKMVKKNSFVEWSKVYGDFRGATKKEIERLINKKTLALWKVDFQGVKKIKNKMPGVLAIFIRPPSLAVLEKRLIKRGQDSLETIRKRMPFAKKWLKEEKIYDYVLVNREGRLEEAIKGVLGILKKNLRSAPGDLDF